MLARKRARINGDEAMFAGLVHDIGVFYPMSRAANFPELVADKVELHNLLVGWHDNIGRPVVFCQPKHRAGGTGTRNGSRGSGDQDLVRCPLRRQQDRQPLEQRRDPEVDAQVDTSMLDAIFDAETLAEIIDESGRSSVQSRHGRPSPGG